MFIVLYVYINLKLKFYTDNILIPFSIWKVALEAARGEFRQVAEFIMKYVWPNF